MKNVYTVVGRPYAVTTSVSCTISTPDGILIASCEPGYQVVFVAPCDVVCVSHDAAHVTETFSAAASAASGGGRKKAIMDYVDGKAAEVALAASAETSAAAAAASDLAVTAASEAKTYAIEALTAHAQSANYHLQTGERDNWNSLVIPGMIIAALRTSVPGYLICQGQAVSRTTYAALFAVLGTTFGDTGNSTTFYLPNFKGRCLWGADGNMGTYLSAGLPNVTGNLNFVAHGGARADGAFQKNDYSQSITGIASGAVFSEGWGVTNFAFKASLKNAIYGAANTVRPPSLAVNFFIKY